MSEGMEAWSWITCANGIISQETNNGEARHMCPCWYG